MSPSERILAENGKILDRMLTHRFVHDIMSGTLPPEVFRRYLAYEGTFVRTAIGIFAYATARAPGLTEQRWLIGVQAALAGEQTRFFEETWQALAIEQPTGTLPPAVRDFNDGMRRIAETGSFTEIVTAMFAAEWMYWKWCKAAAGTSIADRHVRRWVLMHADEAFGDQARRLGDAIDCHARDGETERLSKLFGKVMELEIAFHHAPYAETGRNRNG